MSKLKIFLLGSFRVERDGEVIQEEAWMRRKAKGLLKLLALRPEHRLHREQAMELLWPELDEEAARSNLYRTLYRLRQVLEPDLSRPADSQHLTLKEEWLRLGPPEALWIDVEAFETILKDARTALDPVPLLEEAVGLYRGDLLEEDPYEEWAMPRRDEFKRSFISTLLTLAKSYRQRGAFDKAAAALEQILTFEPTDEVVHRELMLTYTRAGRRNEALRQYQLCVQNLSEELGLEPDSETTTLFERIQSGDVRSELPGPLVTLQEEQRLSPAENSFFNNLPAFSTDLVGREEEVAFTCELLLRSDVRLVTLTGPGGVGKTRLALEVAHSLLEDFKQGVCLVNLATLHDPASLVLTIAETLGIKEAGSRPLLERLVFQLREKEMLLVLDNFEQIVSAATIVSKLLAECPDLKVLITSQALLRLYGEHELVVPPLELPDTRYFPHLEALAECPSVKLFVQRAQALKPDFMLTPENGEVISQICLRLDGLPLAIELAAARIKLFSPQALQARLGSRLDVLTSTSRDLPARQRTLRNTIEWSYDLLDEGERLLFARLGVFEGGCRLEDAEVVCNLKGDLPDVPGLLEGLVDKSLVYIQERKGPAGYPEHYFQMLMVIQEYALERLRMSGEEETIKQLHASLFLNQVEEIEHKLHGKEQKLWLKYLETESDNLRAALTWLLLQEREMPEEAVEKGLRVAGALAWFWWARGYWSEGRKWLELALSRAEKKSNSPVFKTAYAKVLYGLGSICIAQGDAESAQGHLEGSLQLWRELEDKWGIAHTLDSLAELNRSRGNYNTALPLYETSLELCGEIMDDWCANHELIGLGYVNYQQGDLSAAIRYFESALASCRELGDRSGTGNALNGLGELARQQGKYAQAVRYYEESLSLYQDLGRAGNCTLLLHNLGYALANLGKISEAKNSFRECLVLSREINSKRYIAWALIGLAGCEERPEQAAFLIGAAEGLLQSTGTRLEPINRVEFDRIMGTIRSNLSENDFKRAWAEGKAQGTEKVIAQALEAVRH